MTKKDFQALATALRETRPGGAFNTEEHRILYGQWLDIRQAIAIVCANDNPRFDVCRFLDWTEK